MTQSQTIKLWYFHSTELSAQASKRTGLGKLLVLLRHFSHSAELAIWMETTHSEAVKTRCCNPYMWQLRIPKNLVSVYRREPSSTEFGRTVKSSCVQVTLAACCSGYISVLKAIAYVVSQICGGICGSLLLVHSLQSQACRLRNVCPNVHLQMFLSPPPA